VPEFVLNGRSSRPEVLLIGGHNRRAVYALVSNSTVILDSRSGGRLDPDALSFRAIVETPPSLLTTRSFDSSARPSSLARTRWPDFENTLIIAPAKSGY
jgi:hypothetical protein